MEYILLKWPAAATIEDNTGKTPLHWAAGGKTNPRAFNLLVQAGADEIAVDHVSIKAVLGSETVSNYSYF